MGKAFILCMVALVLVVGVSVISCGTAPKKPDWATRERDVWVEKGVIYARGSAESSSRPMSLTAAEARARGNLSRAVANGEIIGFPPIPADNKVRTPFTINGISGELGDMAVIGHIFIGNTAYVLLSCNGAEIRGR